MSYIQDNLNDTKYIQWLDENDEHLDNMYQLSGLDCGIDVFSRYVYNNSITI